MLDDKDIQKIVEANREVFATKQDLEYFRDDMRKNFADLQSGVDGYAKKAEDYFQEMVMLSHKIDRHEKWIQQLAKKFGVSLEY